MRTPELLDFVPIDGKNISHFCSNGYDDKLINHCAHFVSHLLGYNVAFTNCANVMGRPKEGQAGVTIRVDDIFNKCSKVGTFDPKKPPAQSCLVFITKKSVVKIGKAGKGTMSDHPMKHIGIFVHQTRRIWHYSNSRDCVTNQTPDDFCRHYGIAKDIGVYWGNFLT